MPEKQRITLQIVSRKIALNVIPEQEPFYRDAAVKINEKYQQYQRAYPNLPVEQIWIYVALEMAVNLHSDAREKNIEPILSKIRELNQLIEETLKNEE